MMILLGCLLSLLLLILLLLLSLLLLLVVVVVVVRCCVRRGPSDGRPHRSGENVGGLLRRAQSLLLIILISIIISIIITIIIIVIIVTIHMVRVNIINANLIIHIIAEARAASPRVRRGTCRSPPASGRA